MMLLVVLIIVISAILFTILFLYLYRVYIQLKIRHKPPQSPSALENRPEFAFVLAHGVDAYNEQRRQRRHQDRLHARLTSSSNDAVSIQSSTLTDISEPLPAYTTTATLGRHHPVLGSTSIITTPPPTTTTTPTTYPIDYSSPPPMYIYQPPSSRSTVQAALLTTDNSPSVSIMTPSGNTQTDPVGDHRPGQSPSINGVIPRTTRPNNERSTSMASSLSSSSSTPPPPLPPPSSPPTENQTLEDPLVSEPVVIEQVASDVTPPSDATIVSLPPLESTEGQYNNREMV